MASPTIHADLLMRPCLAERHSDRVPYIVEHAYKIVVNGSETFEAGLGRAYVAYGMWLEAIYSRYGEL